MTQIAVQERPDLLQRDAQAAQRDNTVQSPDVAAGVAAVPAFSPRRGRQQAELIVMMQRPDREPGLAGQLADPPRPVQS